MTPNVNEYLWTEKYRPKTIEDCVLPDAMKETFTAILKKGELPNMLFCGTAGVGKTTIARALCEMLDCDYIIINGSEESGIDVLRNKIRQFASTISMHGGTKVVILDEADYLNPTSTQPALRGFIEEFSNNCRFIFTCNFKNRIIEALHSRCAVIEFNTPTAALAGLAGRFMKRMEKILNLEEITYDKGILANLIISHAPDWRRVLNECQRYSSTGTLNPCAIVGMSDQNMAQLFGYLKTKDFKAMRGWVSNNVGLDGTVVFRKVYDSLYDTAKPESIPAAVLIIAEYSYKMAFCADKEINVVACMTELMGSVNWK
jgi:DNA polymerase III delta prime subunit